MLKASVLIGKHPRNEHQQSFSDLELKLNAKTFKITAK